MRLETDGSAQEDLRYPLMRYYIPVVRVYTGNPIISVMMICPTESARVPNREMRVILRKRTVKFT